jgi:hypothetical protein
MTMPISGSHGPCEAKRSNPQRLLLTKAKQWGNIFICREFKKLKPCNVNQCKVLMWVGGGVDKFFLTLI